MTAEYTVLAEGLDFPEGPVFDEGCLWGVEMRAGRLFRWTPDGLMRLDVGGRPNGLAIRDGQVFFCDADRDGMYHLGFGWPETVAIEPVAESGPDQALTAPNDAIFDPRGVLIFTCPGDPKAGPVGSVWARDPDGRVVRIATDMAFPNGLVLTPDGRDLIVAETMAQRLWRGRWDSETLTWRDARPYAETGGAPLGPDGMAYGADGLLYVALYGSGVVLAFDDAGKIVRRIPTPGDKPTNIAFDPTGVLGMVVTEAINGQLLSYPDVGRP
jgi:gluconolactonase